MALTCAATPAATPTPAGPVYSEEETIAVVKEHLQTSAFCETKVLARGGSKQWSARYNPLTRRRNVLRLGKRSLKSVAQGTG